MATEYSSYAPEPFTGTDEAGWRADFDKCAPLIPSWFTEEQTERARRIYVRRCYLSWLVDGKHGHDRPGSAIALVVRASDRDRPYEDREDSLARLDSVERWIFSKRAERRMRDLAANPGFLTPLVGAARVLECSERQVRRLIRSGELEMRRIGGEPYLDSNQVWRRVYAQREAAQ